MVNFRTNELVQIHRQFPSLISVDGYCENDAQSGIEMAKKVYWTRRNYSLVN